MTDDTSPHPSPASLVYANTAGVSGGPFDVAIDFGYATHGGGGEEMPKIEWRTRVAMSWEHASALNTLLAQQLASYQEVAGPLPSTTRPDAGGDEANDND